MKKIAVIQSNYIPWKGYFDIIHDVDEFIFYDDVQFTKNDWRNRNQVKTSQGLCWLTIPVGPRVDRLINEVEIEEGSWNKKHWETIKQTYSKAPYFKYYREFFESVYLEKKWTNLSQFNQFLIKTISCEFLGIKTTFRNSTEFCPEGHKLDRLIDLLVKAKADLYVSGPSAKAYIEEEMFQKANVQLVFKDYSNYPEYPQLYPPFVHAVSILDVIFTCGSSAADYIWGWREQSIEKVQEQGEVRL